MVVYFLTWMLLSFKRYGFQGGLDVEIFSWKTITLYVQIIELKDRLEVCLFSSLKAIGQPKFKVVFHENVVVVLLCMRLL